MLKRTYSAFSLEDALQLIPTKQILPWNPAAPSRPPSADLLAHLRRLKVFDLTMTEMAKTLLIDALLAETVPEHKGLKVWKAMPLETDTLAGITDYLITPDYAFVSTPLLCAVEAKRDDFVQGQAQVIAEMAACRQKNNADRYESDVFGIVSNGQTWQFYKLTQTTSVFSTDSFSLNDLPSLLGVLDAVCALCAAQLPPG